MSEAVAYTQTPVTAPPSALRRLRWRFNGSVLEPGGPGWESATQAFNLSVVQEPALVAVPADEQDVAAVVDFAREHGMQVAAQRTGHNAEPLGELRDVILLKTDALKGVQIHPGHRAAHVRSGSKWLDVVPQASSLGLAALHGSTPDVSVAGYSLGGGVGWYARKLGLSANSVKAIELVTADGRLRRVDRDNEPDLFWALRGGGGSFGVVTALEIQLYPVDEVYAGVLFFPWERSADVLHAWLDWTATVPDEVTSVGRILQFPPLELVPEPMRGRNFAVVEAVVLGDEQLGRDLVRPLRALGPELDTFAMVPPAGIAELHMDPPVPVPYTGEGELLDQLDHEAIDRFVAAAGPGSGSPLISAEIRHLGGALAEARPEHGALGTLDGAFLTFGVGMVLDAESYRANRAQLELLDQAFAPYDSGRQYLNFTERPTNPARFYGAETYRRLRAVKTAVDPENVFRANHSIPPA